MAFLPFYFRTTVLYLLLAHFFIFTESDILEDYIKNRKNASCLNIDVCDQEVLTEYLYSDIKGDFYPDSRCCSRCECDQHCFRRGDCCPDILLGNMKDSNIPTGGLYRCVKGNMKIKKWINYLMIRKCLTNYTNPKVIQKCHEDPTSGLDVFVPVSNNASGDTYRNQYCAECNFEEPGSLTSWKVELGCSSEPIKKIIPNTLISDVLAATDCDLYLIPPLGVRFENCTDVIDTCNQTGLWQSFDLNIATACDLYRAPFLKKTYRNIFCYLCNLKTYNPFLNCREVTTDDRYPPPPFSLLFDFINVADVAQLEAKEDTCPVGTAYIALLDACYVKKCETGFNHTDGECRPAVNNFCMEAFLVLQPVVNITRHRIDELHEAIEDAINQTSLLPMNDLAWDVHIAEQIFVFHVKFLFSALIGNSLIDFSRHLFNVTLLENDLVLNTSTEFHIPFNVTLQDEVSAYLSYDHPFLNLTYHTFELPVFGLIGKGSFYNDNLLSMCNMGYSDLHVFTKFTTCLWVELENKDLEVSFTDEGLYFKDSGFTLPNKSFVIINSDLDGHNDSVIKVCVDDIASYTASRQQKLNSEVLTSESLGYLTLATSCLSIISCMLTVITYILLKPLRTQPGINNMTLSIFIFLGHVLFLLSSYYGNPRAACLFMGGLLHFLWLSVMFWYLVCCFHTFRVFHLSATKPDNNILITTLKYTLFVTCTSLCCIGINVMASAFLSNNENFGYSYNAGGLCWISNSILLGLTITLPSLLSVVCNAVLFAIAVHKISTGIKVELRSNKNRQTFLIYIKLSVLTGITWLTIIPYIFTRIEVFNYIFTCLNGLNGVFLVVAFLINKRVYILYRSLVFGKEIDRESTSTRRTTNTSIRENASDRQRDQNSSPECKHPNSQNVPQENIGQALQN